MRDISRPCKSTPSGSKVSKTMNPYAAYMTKQAISMRTAKRILAARGGVGDLGDIKNEFDISAQGFSMGALYNKKQINGKTLPYGLGQATLANLDRTAMSGRHAPQRGAITIPKSYDDEANVARGRGIAPHIGYRGTGPTRLGRDVGGPIFDPKEKDPDPYWQSVNEKMKKNFRHYTGMPEIAEHYAKKNKTSRIDVYDFSNVPTVEGFKFQSDPVDRGNRSTTYFHAARNQSSFAPPPPHSNSPFYEGAMAESILDSARHSRLKRLPGGNYQQVQGKTPVSENPLNRDYGVQIPSKENGQWRDGLPLEFFTGQAPALATR